MSIRDGALDTVPVSVSHSAVRVSTHIPLSHPPNQISVQEFSIQSLPSSTNAVHIYNTYHYITIISPLTLQTDKFLQLLNKTWVLIYI